MNQTAVVDRDTDAVKLLPKNIRDMNRQELELASKDIGFYVSVGDGDDFLKLMLYFASKGYEGCFEAPLAALEFAEGYRHRDKETFERTCIDNLEMRDLGYGDGSPPAIYHSLLEYMKANPPKPPTPDLVSIVSRCLVMMYQAETGGANASEPQWRAVLSILKFCKASGDDIKELTGSHKDFDKAATDAKLEAISAPFLCSSFYDNRNLCNQCKYKEHIKSPISLGYEYAPKCGGRSL